MRHASFDVAPRGRDTLPGDLTLTTAQVGREPMNKIRVKGSVADLVKKQRVINGVEGFRNVNRHSGGALRRFSLIKTIGDTRHSRQEGGDTRVKRAEAVLGRGRREDGS